MTPMPAPVTDALRRRWVPGPDYVGDPRAWVADRLPSTTLWSKQWEVIESVRDHPNTAVRSCHSAGKSFIASTTAGWWIDSHPAGEAFVVTSAPTGDQVKAILWREMNRMHRQLYGGERDGGRMNLTEWYDQTGELIAFGRKPNDYEPTAFQGIHALYVLVILDEACGIPESLWDAASSLTSNENGRILAIGNPDDPQSHFASVCGRDTWNVIHISAFDTPNFTGEEVPERLSLSLVSERWVEEKKKDWTETSPLYISKVLGEFPTDADDGVVPNSWAQKCRYLELQPSGSVELGVDPARGGSDRAVCWARRGSKALRKWVWPYTPDPKELAELLLEVILETKATEVKIDADGLGWGISGILDVFHEEGKHNAISTPVFGSAAAGDEEHFLNQRAEIWWNARELSRLEAWDLGALDDDDLHEMTTPKFHTNNPRRRIQIEKKEDLGKRLGKSPDSADALLLAFWTPVFEAEDLTGDVASARL